MSNIELKTIVALVKASNKPVLSVVQSYMNSVVWSLCKFEWNRMSKTQRAAFCRKLEKQIRR